MAQYIEVKGDTIEFPDGMSQDEMRAIIKRNMMSVKPNTSPAPVEDPGFGQTMLIGAGRTVDRVGKGMQQAYYGLTGNTAKQDELKATAAEDDRVYKPLQKARPWATGLGEALPSMVIPGGGSTTLLGNVGRMALAGAAVPAMEYGTAGQRLENAAFGAAGASAVPVLGAALKTAKSLAEPLYAAGRANIAGRTLNRVAGDDAPNVIAKLNGGQPLIPGSLPTVGQLSENGGINALFRAAEAANPADYTTRFKEQAAARLKALQGVAGDDATMAAAVDARKSASEALYEQSRQFTAPIDSMFNGLKMRPQFNAAIARATALAKDGGLEDIFFRDKTGKPVALMGEGAHFIKKALDEAAEYGSSSYTGKHAATSAGKTNELFQTWLEKSIPEYGAAKAAYAAKSVPINQMEIGQALLNKVQPALADYGAQGTQTGATFARALRDGDNLAAKATGFPGARMESVLDPAQFATVENIAKDLARKTNEQGLGRGAGSDTFQKLSMGNIAQQSGAPGFVGGLLELPGISRATKWAYRDSDEKMQKVIADAMLDPKKAADLMKSAGTKWMQDHPELRQLLEQSVIRSGGLLGGAALSNP